MSIKEPEPFIPLERRPWRDNIPTDQEKTAARSSMAAARAAVSGATSQEIEQLLPLAGDIESESDEQLNWQDRLEVLVADYGFLPTTREELNRAFAVIPFLQQKGKTAAHLNEILLHNKSAEVSEPADAVRSVVASMGVYVEDATAHVARLEELQAELEQVNPNLSLKLAGVVSSPALLDIVQFQDLRSCVETGDATVLAGGVRKDEAQHRELRTHYDPKYHDDLLVELKVGKLIDQTVVGVRGDIKSAIESHKNRATFWNERVVESRLHGAARQVADRILKTV